jgi:hypothetical protein
MSVTGAGGEQPCPVPKSVNFVNFPDNGFTI